MHQLEDRLGELRSVHRPSIWPLLFMAMVALAPLFLFGLGVVVLIDDFVHGRATSANKVLTPIGCLGVLGLILVLLIGFLVSEFRKWYPTRSVRLKIFERGFTYEEHNQVQVCAWDEIKDITHRKIKIHRWHSASRRISIIRSIVKRDGTVIVLAETLNLHKLTRLIEAGKTSATAVGVPLTPSPFGRGLG